MLHKNNNVHHIYFLMYRVWNPVRGLCLVFSALYGVLKISLEFTGEYVFPSY